MATVSLLEKSVHDAYDYARGFLHTGKVATYIPQLAEANPGHLGVCLRTQEETYAMGDCQVYFTMQSISKVFALILALQEAGYDRVFSKVGMEPTGDAFNSIVKLETKNHIPLNPMINAGAIAVTSCIQDTFEEHLQKIRKFCQCDGIGLNASVYNSEKETGMTNRSLAYLMQSKNLLERDAESVVDLYFKFCSIQVTTAALANFALLLSHNGVDFASKEQIIDPSIVRIVKTIMFTCGLYDGSGAFAVKVGMPSKSGVGGGIIACTGKQMGIAVYGPALDDLGNSVGGVKALEHLSDALQLHAFAPPLAN